MDDYQQGQRLDRIAARQAARQVPSVGPIVSYGTPAPPEVEMGIAGRKKATAIGAITID
jgi:hypothetical protein